MIPLSLVELHWQIQSLARDHRKLIRKRRLVRPRNHTWTRTGVDDLPRFRAGWTVSR
jgi:hypothetical protein